MCFVHVPPVFCFAEIGHAVREGFVICVTDRNILSLPLTREVAKRSFDGGRERGKSLNDVVRPLSLSLANARQLPRQREPREAE